jgi:hypothetical protein
MRSNSGSTGHEKKLPFMETNGSLPCLQKPQMRPTQSARFILLDLITLIISDEAPLYAIFSSLP